MTKTDPEITKLEKTFYFTNILWWPFPAVLHMGSNGCVKVEVFGDNGWVILHPDAGSKSRFKSGDETTIVDFEVYVCYRNGEMSTFKVDERDTVGKHYQRNNVKGAEDEEEE